MDLNFLRTIVTSTRQRLLNPENAWWRYYAAVCNLFGWYRLGKTRKEAEEDLWKCFRDDGTMCAGAFLCALGHDSIREEILQSGDASARFLLTEQGESVDILDPIANYLHF